MTNEMIVLEKRMQLLELGEIGSTGNKIEFNGKIVDEPEEIHTFAEWKRRGFVVRRGEHAIAKFPIWKFYGGEKKDPDDEEDFQREGAHCALKMSYFFKKEQVDERKSGGYKYEK